MNAYPMAPASGLWSAFVAILVLAFGCLQVLPASDSPPQPAQLLKPFVATYMVTAMGLEGINVTNSLSVDNLDNLNNPGESRQAYHFKSYSMPVGLLAFKKDETRNEQSEGFIIDGVIRPLKYSFLQIRNNRTRRNVELIFNWDKKQVTNYHKHKNSKWVMAIPENTVDKLSYQLAMMLELSGHPDKTFRLNIADGGKIKEYDFTVEGEERVYTSLGSYKTVKVHHHRYNKEKNITLWCAPELGYLPVKIVQEEPGKPDFVSTLISYQEGMTGN